MRRIVMFIVVLMLLPITGRAADRKFLPNDHVVILLYHTFMDEIPKGQGIDTYVNTTPAKFRKDLKKLLEAGFAAITLEQYYTGNYDRDGYSFIVTFDDGYLTNYTIAYPILRELNVPADIFINTDNVVLSHHFTWEQARDMEESGLVKIYSHYPTHVSALSVDSDEFKRELMRSYADIDLFLGTRLKMFAYPYSDYSEQTYDTAKSAGTLLQFVQSADNAGDDVCYRVQVTYKTKMADVIDKVMKNSK